MTEQQKRVPINTSKEARKNPIVPLVGSMIFGLGQSIDRQEAQGQQSFVDSETLPTDMARYGGYDPKAVLEAAGVKFLGEVEDDPMFQYVELPAGWKKEPTNHPMWSKLLDDKGREHASIFYKAAFYDRNARLHLTPRFGFHRDYDKEEKEGIAVTHITDGVNVIHTTKPIKLPDDNLKRYEVSHKADETAVTWLDKRYPDWRNPGAYWD